MTKKETTKFVVQISNPRSSLNGRGFFLPETTLANPLPLLCRKSPPLSQQLRQESG